MKRQSGFTLIELIIVIVILGILAVTVAPQFFNFGSDARASTVRGLEGSINAAKDLVYARSAIAGIETESTGAVSFATSEGVDSGPQNVDVVYGYPAASAAGIQRALNINVEDWDIATGSVTIDGAGVATIRFSPSDFNAEETFNEIENCSVSYSQATTEGDQPTVVVNVQAC